MDQNLPPDTDPAVQAAQQPAATPAPPGAQTRRSGPLRAALGRFPQAARDRMQWLLAGPNAKGELKVPLSVGPTGDLYHGSSTDAGTWLAFDVACAAADHYGYGIGYVLHDADPFTCVDFDVKNATNAPNKPNEWTTATALGHMWNMVQDLDSYTERSQSGIGLHVWVRGKFDGDGLKRKGVEVYCRARFIACTGDHLQGMPLTIEDRESDVRQLVGWMRSSGAPALEELVEQEPMQDDAALLERMRGFKNADKLAALWAGEWATWTEPGDNGEPRRPYPSQSEADMALMGLLAQNTKSNEQCRRLFLDSALGKRDKASGPKGDRYLNRMLRKIRGREAERDAVRVSNWERSKAVGEGELPVMTAPVMTAAEMCAQLVFVRNGSAVAWRDQPRNHYKMSDAAHVFAGCLEARIIKDQLKMVRCMDEWRGAGPKRVDVEGLTFDPRYGTFCADPEGRHALNMWVPRAHAAPTNWADRAKPFEAHIDFLVPVQAERKVFKQWLADIERNPGRLPHFGFLMIATRQGVGRNWLAAVLAHVWRGHVALDFDLGRMLAQGYNGQLSQKLLGVQDEIYIGDQHEMWKFHETMKSMMTATERHINPKYGVQRMEFNCMRWLAFSNHEAALPITDMDRRWFVVRNPEPHQGPSYYDGLYALLDDPLFIAGVREWLRSSVDLSDFNPGMRPEMNEAKRAVVAAARSEAMDNAAALARDWPRDVITTAEFIEAVWGEHATQAQRAMIKHRARDAKIVRWRGPDNREDARPTVGGRPQAVWIVRNPERWAHADADALRHEWLRNRTPN